MAKTGGLGDVSSALPRALRALGHDVVILMPAYSDMTVDGTLHSIVPLPANGSWPTAQLLQVKAADGMFLWLISCPALFGRADTPYSEPASASTHEHAMRFGLLSRIAALLGTEQSPCDWRADIVHANDWPCGLAPLYLHQARAQGQKCVARSLMTVHNLAFQGVFPMETADVLGVDPINRGMDGVEYWGQLSMLKAGLQFADAITTVSPTYAREIQQPAFGFGLDGVLRARSERLHGILNGMDTWVWSPRTDPLIQQTYDVESVALKAENKAALRARCGLKSSAAPLFGFVGRLTEQKGVDLVVAGAPRFLGKGAQLAVLGKGERSLEESLGALAARFPGQVHVTLGFDEALAHQIEAGADCFLMPSRFEPCGLNQMYSQAYGTPPLVTNTGGLADTVSEQTDSHNASGFVMRTASQEEFDAAIDRVLVAWENPDRWQKIQAKGMRNDFGWEKAALKYQALAISLTDED